MPPVLCTMSGECGILNGERTDFKNTNNDLKDYNTDNENDNDDQRNSQSRKDNITKWNRGSKKAHTTTGFCGPPEYIKVYSGPSMKTCSAEEDDCGHCDGKDVQMVRNCCCDKDWVDFTESTSLHGLRYIWLRNSIWFRRLLWLTLTLACLGVMMYQILDRVIYYDSLPVTVNVKINFNKSLQFPSVTMCNQNAFRASAAESIGRYPLITDMFDDVMAFNVSDLEKYNASDLSFEELYREAGHRKEDLIVSCEWRGQKCGPDNFTEIATDHGKCFTFNYFNDNQNYLVVDSPGSEDGLSLTLNVEQYEYMPGPNDAAGLKVLVHHPHQFPHVKGLGVVLPAGSHSFIGTKMVSVENLPRPHGQCSSPSLRHFQHYSTESCDIDCRSMLLKDMCNCRLHYMKGQDTPVCNLKQYYACYKPNIHYFRRLTKEKCDCPVPCQMLSFDTSVSYANTSPLVAERFLAQTNRSALKSRYDAARDVTHRLQVERRQILFELIASLDAQLRKVSNLIVTHIEDKLQQQSQAWTDVSRDVGKVYKRAKYLFRYQKYIVDKDFIRARDAMKERTFSVVHMAMQEYIFQVETAIKQLVDKSITSEDVRQVVFLDVIRQLDARKDIAHRATQNYTQFLQALQLGQPIFNYKFKRELRKYSPFIVPLPLFHRTLNLTKTIRWRVKFMGDNLGNISAHLDTLREIALGAFVNKSLNFTQLHLGSVRFLHLCRQYSQSMDMFLFDVPEKIMESLQSRDEQLDNLWRMFTTAKDDSIRQVNSLMTRLIQMKSGMLGAITDGLSMAREFLKHGRFSKKQVAAQFLQEDVQETQASLKNFFNEVRSRGHALFDNWLELEKSAIEIWTMVIEDRNLQTYYEARNLTDFLVDSADKAVQISEQYGRFRNDLDLRHIVRNVDTEFVKSLAAMLKEMKQFQETEDIDGKFMQQNILRLNIFYRELNYEQITQQEAYDIFALLCDIGGSMGLFLGASVITIFEFFDLFLFTYMKKLISPSRR